MRILAFLSLVLLLPACGSQTPSSLWHDVTDTPEGWHDGESSRTTVKEMEPFEESLVEPILVPVDSGMTEFPEPTQLSK